MDKGVIKFYFEDGLYSFWQAWVKGRDQKIVFRVKETGEDAWHTPQQRMENLLKEVVQLYDPESVEHYKKFTEFAPADMSQVVRWFAGHQGDMYNFMLQHAIFGGMTRKQRAKFKSKVSQ